MIEVIVCSLAAIVLFIIRLIVAFIRAKNSKRMRLYRFSDGQYGVQFKALIGWSFDEIVVGKQLRLGRKNTKIFKPWKGTKEEALKRIENYRSAGSQEEV